MLRRALAIVLVVLWAPPLLAADNTSEEVRFPSGSNHLLIATSLTGDQSREYRFDARQGQSVAVRFDSPALGSFTLVAPDGSPLFNGQMSDATSFEGRLPVSGDYSLRVYLGGPQVAAGRTAAFQLTIRITG